MSLKRRVALGQIAGYLFILAGILGHLLLGLPAWGTAVTIMAGFLIIVLTLLLALLAIDRASRDWIPVAWHIELQGGPHDGLQMEISRPVEEILMAVVITPPPPLIAYPIIPVMPPIRLADALYRNAGIIRAGVLIYRHHERPAS